MKKITIVAVMAIAAATIVSCGQSPAKANLKNDIDSASYASGVQQADRFNQAHVLEQMEVDSAYLSDFIQGINDAASASDNQKKLAYFMGANIGIQIVKGIFPQMNASYFGDDSTKTMSKGDFLAAFIECVKGGKLAIAAEEADSVLAEFNANLTKKRYAENKKAGEDFIAETAKNDSVQKTESGLLYKVLTEGKGPKYEDGQSVKLTYEGRLIDGIVFDSTEKHGGEPITFKPTEVIPGFGEALKMMPVGSEWEIYIPQELAYGERGSMGINPYSALIFKIKLLDLVKE